MRLLPIFALLAVFLLTVGAIPSLCADDEVPPKTKAEKVRELLAIPGPMRELLATARDRILADPYLTPMLHDKMSALHSPEAWTETIVGIFAEWASLGDVTDIVRADLLPHRGQEIAVAGEGAALVTDDATRQLVLVELRFKTPLRRPAIVDADGDYQVDFAERGGDRAGALVLLDQNRRVRWTVGGEPAALSMAVGDLDFGPDREFVVGFAGDGGLQLLERDGELLWTEPGRDIRHVEIADLDGIGRPEIIHGDGAGRITIREASGAILERLHPSPPVTRFSTARWPNRDSPARILVWDGRGQVRLLDAHGKTVHELDLPEGPRADWIAATPVALRDGEPPCFALLVRYATPGRARAGACRGAGAGACAAAGARAAPGRRRTENRRRGGGEGGVRARAASSGDRVEADRARRGRESRDAGFRAGRSIGAGHSLAAAGVVKDQSPFTFCQFMKAGIGSRRT